MSGANKNNIGMGVLEKRVSCLLDKAAHYYQMPFPPPVVLLDILGADAGQALPESNTLRFNPVFFSSFQTHYLKHVVAHEVAHLVSHHVFGKKIRPHGKEWTEVMTTVFNLPATRCHSYDLNITGRYPYLYQCNCHGKQTPFSVIRHRRVIQGVVYLCRHCRGKLIFSHAKERLAGKTLTLRS